MPRWHLPGHRLASRVRALVRRNRPDEGEEQRSDAASSHAALETAAVAGTTPAARENAANNVGWRAFGCSVRGAAHVRGGLPNQDAADWSPESGAATPLLVAVADGHGSPRCFRSDRGACLAVQAALGAMQRLLAGQPDQADPAHLSAVKRIAMESLPLDLVRAWDEAVAADLEVEPFSDEELERLETAQGSEARRSVEAQPRFAYGSTILCALVTDSLLLCLQLGDGDILMVSETGDVERPVPGDARLFANETTSLARERAWQDVRVAFMPLAMRPPALVLLSTDGYANSFQSDADFRQVGPDLLALLRSDGVDGVAGQIESWLREASSEGSGDDVSLLVVCRLGALVREVEHGATAES